MKETDFYLRSKPCAKMFDGFVSISLEFGTLSMTPRKNDLPFPMSFTL